MDEVTEIAAVIQAGYEDATQTQLDFQVARAIRTRLVEMGWVPFGTLAAIIEAAGGEVTVPRRLLDDPPTELARFDNIADDSVTIKSHRRRRRSWRR